MRTKTMEGLIGARTNMELLNTPFRVYKEARRRGDTAAMERAMGYVNDFSNEADEYKAQADEGMKEDAEDAREKAAAQCEESIRRRREEQESFEKKLEEKQQENKTAKEGNSDADTVEISEDGKELLKDGEADAGGAKMEPVVYTSDGEVLQGKPQTGGTVSVTV